MTTKNKTGNSKTKILKFVQERFLSEGFYKTSMDEIARDLQMSKKTIYKFFSSKDKLLDAVANRLLQKNFRKIQNIIETDENVIVKMVNLLDFANNMTMKFSKRWMRDLQIHAPHVWNKIDRLRREKLFEVHSKLIKQGKKEGFIKDYPDEIIVTIFVASLRAIVNPVFLLNHNFSNQQAINLTFEILLNGILTEEGKIKYQALKEELHKEESISMQSV